MASPASKRNGKSKSKVSLPTEDDADWPTDQSHQTSRPGTAKGRPSTAKSKRKNVSIDSSAQSITPRITTKSHSYKPSSTLSVAGSLTPTGRVGLTYRDVQESMYPPPNGQKHLVMGRKRMTLIGNINSIQSAVQRGFKLNRKIEKSRNFAGAMSEQETREVSEADEMRLTMMSNYFASKIDDYKYMIEKCKEDARKKREKNKSRGVHKINALKPFMMSKKFYNMMEADISQVYIAYRRLSSTSSTKKMGSYDHIMYDDQIKDGLVEHKTKFVHLVCKPYQCWMNLFQIDENAAKELSQVGLLVLEHFNKVGRYKQAFPKWLIDLRGWEHSVALQYLAKPVHIFEVIDHIKNGNYWARYHQYLREENDDVYFQKWTDGTDYFPHKSVAVYWYFHDSDIDHWMTLEEYMTLKNAGKTGSNSKSKKSILADGDAEHMFSDDSLHGSGGSNDGDQGVEGGVAKKKKKKKARDSVEDQSIADMAQHGADEDAEDVDDPDIEDRGLEYLDIIQVTDSEPDEEVYSSSASDDSIPVNKHIYRCPLPLTTESAQSGADAQLFDDFSGWTAYHRSFVGFISRDLLQIDDCEREMARNPSEDHWRRRHLAMGNGFDLPICQYRLISKKLNLEHEVRENLRMIAILKKNGISARAELTESKYMPGWVKFKAQTHFNKLFAQIRKQQIEYTPQKKQLLETLRLEIQTREGFNRAIAGNIVTKKGKLRDNLSKLKMLHDRQIALINYIVTAKHRVANAKLKVAYARKQVEILESDVKDLREMTPREQEFARRNKHYYEAMSVHKLCKQYHSLKRNNYDPNEIYLAQYREKIKNLLKRAALYNLWFWSVKQRYQSHKKYEVIQHGYDLINPCKNWNVSDSTISELLLSDEKYQELNSYDPHKMRKEEYLFKLKEQEKKENQLPDDDEDKPQQSQPPPPETQTQPEAPKEIPQIRKDELEFERAFYLKKRETDKYASISMGNQSQQQHILNEKLQSVLEIMKKFQINDELQRKSRPGRHSISSALGLDHLKRRRISESSIPGLFDTYNTENAIQNDEDTLARQLAGGQRQQADDFEDEDPDEFDEDEEEYWTEDEEYETGDEDDTEFSNQSESFDSQDEEYYDDEDGQYSDMQQHSLQHIKPTIYTDEYDDDAESNIETDDEYEEDDMHGDIHHKRDLTRFDSTMPDDEYEAKQAEYMGVSGKINVEATVVTDQQPLSGMGTSGFLSLGTNDRGALDHYDDDEYVDVPHEQPQQQEEDDEDEYESDYDSDDEEYETGTGDESDEELLTEDEEEYDDDETQTLQNRYKYNNQQSFSMAGGGGGDVIGYDDNDSVGMSSRQNLGGLRQESFSMVGGNHQNNFGLVDPNNDDYDTHTDDED